MKSSVEGEMRLEFRGGQWGLFTPFIVMFLGILWLGIRGAALPEAFWPMVLAGIFAGLLLCRDKERYVEAMVAGIASPLLAIMLLAWFLAGIIGRLLGITGLVEGLVWLAQQVDLSVAWYPLIIFLVSSLLSLSTGTSIGALLAVTPVLFPAGFSLGADPLLMVGALIGGAYVGDNLAPISDTTIVSAYSQGTEVVRVVRSRIRYALVAGAVTIGIYLLIAVAGPSVSTQPVALASSSPNGLIMLLVPAFLAFLMIRGRNLVLSLFYTLVTGLLLGMGTGLLNPGDLLKVDMAQFTSGGVIIEGISSMLGIAVFAILLMGLVGVLEAGGFIDWMIDRARTFATTPRRAELSIVAVTLLTNAMTTAGTPSMVILGPFVRRLGHRFRITPWRRANLLDGCSTSIIGFLPYSLSVLIPFALVAGQVSGSSIEHFSPVYLIPYVFYCWALMLTMILAAVTGWGRDLMSEAEYERERSQLNG